MEQKEKDTGQKSFHEKDQEWKAKQGEQKTKRKGAFASDAVGDSSLFDDERVAYAKVKSKTEAPRPSSFQFTEYDPTKPKRTTKKSVHAFKSKSKYKRRK